MFGGWLLFVGLQLVLVVVACAWVLANDLPLMAQSLSPRFLASLLFTGAQLGLAVVTTLAFLKRKRVTVPLLFAFYLLAIVASVLGEGTGRYGQPPTGNFDELARLVGFVRIVGFTGAWMVYLAQSKRVTRTFVVP